MKDVQTFHDPNTCKFCKAKEEKTLSEFEQCMKGTGMFKDFRKNED
jgi:predicted nucleic acid-binding Zn ribbon protein